MLGKGWSNADLYSSDNGFIHVNQGAIGRIIDLEQHKYAYIQEDWSASFHFGIIMCEVVGEGRTMMRPFFRGSFLKKAKAIWNFWTTCWTAHDVSMPITLENIATTPRQTRNGAKSERESLHNHAPHHV